MVSFVQRRAAPSSRVRWTTAAREEGDTTEERTIWRTRRRGPSGGSGGSGGMTGQRALSGAYIQFDGGGSGGGRRHAGVVAIMTGLWEERRE